MESLTTLGGVLCGVALASIALLLLWLDNRRDDLPGASHRRLWNSAYAPDLVQLMFRLGISASVMGFVALRELESSPAWWSKVAIAWALGAAYLLFREWLAIWKRQWGEKRG